MSPSESHVPRLTQFAAGGGCACKLPAGQLEALLATVDLPRTEGLVIGVETGDDAAAVRIDGDRAVIATTDFFTPVVDDAFDWGRIAATNALSDIWAMGGEPLLALNLVGWPVDKLPSELLGEVLRGGAAVVAEAGCALGGGHSITSPEPLYGLAVTGIGDPATLIRNDAATAGVPLSLTKPIGVGVLNNRHKSTGEDFPEAVEVMTTLNAKASRDALAAGVRAGTDVTGFGLLGHLHKMMRASGTAAVIEAAAVPALEAAVRSIAEGFVPGGSRRNLEWVRPHLEVGTTSDESLLLLADAQTSGGLLVAGEVPGGVVIGEVVAHQGPTITVR